MREEALIYGLEPAPPSELEADPRIGALRKAALDAGSAEQSPNCLVVQAAAHTASAEDLTNRDVSGGQSP